VTSRKAIKRARKRGVTLPLGQTAPQAPRQGRRRDLEPQEHPQAVAQIARERLTGCKGADALNPVLSTDLGKCINHLTEGDERRAMIDAWGAISAAHRNYRLLYVGQTGDPQGANIGMVPEPMETDPSLRVDLRTHDERVTAAKSAWAAWESKLAALPLPQMKWAIRGALDGFLGDAVLWRDRSPTQQGKLGVEAMRRIIATS
jgi:hypothetical protein